MSLWMYSTPTLLRQTTADANGNVVVVVAMPSDVPNGNHRVVVDGINKAGSKVVIGVGVSVGDRETASNTTRILIAVPIALAIGAGFILPNQARRRRRKTATI